MSYRQSSYDPLASTSGPVLKPYDKWQWLGVAFEIVGVIGVITYVAAKRGWLGDAWLSGYAAVPLIGIGALFIAYRRAPGEPVSEAELRRNARRFLLTILAGVAIAAGILLIAHAQGDF